DGQCTVILPAGVDATKIDSISDGVVNKPITSVNTLTNAITFDVSDIMSGKRELKVESDNYIYAFANSIIADMVIKTVDNLDKFGETLKADATTANSYYILGADIDYGGANWSAGWYGSTAKFRGTFDGRGYAVRNYVAHLGLFGELVAESIVKDLYVYAQLKGNANGGAICNLNSGVIENCMVILTVLSGETSVNFAGLAAGNNTSGEIRNCIVKVAAYYGEEKSFNAIVGANSGTISHCFAVSDYSTYLYGEETEGLYASDEEFLAEITELSSEDGWSAYWSIEDNKWYFSDKKIYVPKTVIDIESEIIINTGASEEYTLTLPEEIDAAEVVSVSDEAVIKEIISANVEDNTITFVVAGLTTGKKEIYIETEGIRYVMKNAIVADMVITTVAELNAFGEAMKADETTINSYYILGADIDYGGTNWSAGWYGSTARFRGTFDGRGHAITNYVMHYGLFCDMVVGSEVKDLYVSAKVKGSANGSALSRSNNGHIENCMVLLTVMSGEVGVNFSGIASGNNVSGVINNCIVKVVAYAGQEKTFNAIAELNSGVISDCYAVSTYSTYLYGEETEGLYVSDEEFLAEITELSSEDGWSAYWSIEDNKWYFSDKKIYVPKTVIDIESEIIINTGASEE
ncbi:MAG: hypothetical protein IJQ66_04180, partial [Clostridia bacterium]|nr:hypothetical protein [Clostridia bacterium]